MKLVSDETTEILNLALLKLTLRITFWVADVVAGPGFMAVAWEAESVNASASYM